MTATVKRILLKWPAWSLVTIGVGLVLVLVLVFLYYFWFGVALILLALIALSGYWAWAELPNRYEEGPDAAELAAQERWRRMMSGN